MSDTIELDFVRELREAFGFVENPPPGHKEFVCGRCGEKYYRKFVRVKLCPSCQKARNAVKRGLLKSKRSHCQSLEDRKNEMTRLRFEENLTYQEIGDKYGVSRERVHQIIGCSGSGRKKERMIKIVSSMHDKTNKEVADLLGISISAASRYRNKERHVFEGGYGKLGAEIEEYVSAILDKNGIKHQLMPHHNRFDILLDNGARVDVKSCDSLKSVTRDTPVYSWRTSQNTRGDYADFFVCVIRETKECFVIPSNETRPATPIRFAWPPSVYGKKSKWHKYFNRFDLLK